MDTDILVDTGIFDVKDAVAAPSPVEEEEGATTAEESQLRRRNPWVTRKSQTGGRIDRSEEYDSRTICETSSGATNNKINNGRPGIARKV